MSLLRRRRRQNRVISTITPATRETRFSLAPVEPVRGLRSIITGRKVVRSAEHKRPENLSLPNFQRLRNLKQLDTVKRFHEVMRNQIQPQKIRKPINVIQPDMSIRVDLPPEHPICKRREERREILFAKGKSGKGGQRPRRQNNNIKLRCE